MEEDAHGPCCAVLVVLAVSGMGMGMAPLRKRHAHGSVDMTGEAIEQ